MAPAGKPILLLAGTSGGERRPATSPGPEREWHLPAHVRDPQAVRERMSAQVAAGADVLLAHTFLTHRRALARVGEARRARELTHDAVVLARRAAEQGRDSRVQDAPWASDPVLVAGVVPLLGDDPGGGRLGPVEAAVARDLHDHTGLLADAGVDLIVVEGPRSAAETAVAVRAARSMGIETWAVVDRGTPSAGPDDLGEPDVVLVQVPPAGERPSGDRAASRHERAWPGMRGAMIDALFSAGTATDQRAAVADAAGPKDADFNAADPDAALRQLLASGASVLGIADGATIDHLALVRATIDSHSAQQVVEQDLRSAEWMEWVGQGAARAPTGRALWLSGTTPRDLPLGWDWTVVPNDQLPTMPADSYRLVVSEASATGPAELARRLEPSGVAIFKADGRLPLPASFRILEMRTEDRGEWLICRRQDR